MTGHERIAKANIKACFNFEVGSAYNAYLDGQTEFPTISEMKESIYRLAMTNRYGGGCCFIDRAPREMRFAGKEFCKGYIDYLFSAAAGDTDVAEIPWGKEE